MSEYNTHLELAKQYNAEELQEKSEIATRRAMEVKGKTILPFRKKRQVIPVVFIRVVYKHPHASTV